MFGFVRRIFSSRYFSTSYNLKMAELKTLGTHNGVFHCDEVLGCYMLRLLYPDINIIRSRDPEVLAKCDIVIDVGGVYNPSKNRFDHHQRDFNESASTVIPGKPWTTKLSSCGLVYLHFGKRIIKKLAEDLDESVIEPIFDKLYEGFIQEIDGIDNGINIAEGKLNYMITTNLSSRVSHFNQNWIDTEYDEQASFNRAMEYAGSEFEDKVKRLVKVWWPARTIVKEAIDERLKVHPSGEIIELKVFCPWEEHFFQIENELNISPLIKYLIFRDNSGAWRVRAVPIERGNFSSRIPLAEKWRGLNNEGNSEVLLKASGIEGSIFVHASGFIGGNRTRDGAIEMALKSIELSKKT